MRASEPLQTWIWHLLSSTATHRGDAEGCGGRKVRECFKMLYDSFASRGLFMYISSESKASYKSYTFAILEYRVACKLGVVGGQKELLS